MFRTCTHGDVAASLETISAAFAILESREGAPGNAALISANTLFEEITAQPILDCVGLNLEMFLPRHIEKQIRPCLRESQARHSPQEAELVIEHDGGNRWWRFMVSPLVPVQGGNQRMIVTVLEITDKKLLEQSLDISRQRYAAVVETAYDGIITIDQHQTIMMMNDAARDIFGVNDAAVVGMSLTKYIPQRFRDKHAGYVDAFRLSPVKVRPMQSRSPIYGLREDGSEIQIEVTISKIAVDGGTEMTALVRDVSERTKLIEQLKQAATQDPLTGVFNRRHGDAVLYSEVHRCQRHGHALTLIMLDLDHFKSINDTYGHACGDHVLKSVVDTISGSLRDADIVCRWGGEEFLVMLPETPLMDAKNWAERVRESVAALEISGYGEQPIRVSISCGLAALARTDARPESLLKRADDAMYRAKENGRNQVYVADGSDG